MNTLRLMVLLVLVVASGCSSFSGIPASVHQVPYDLSVADLQAQQLYTYYEAWKGVPHRDGGLDRAGIDCSGFVHLTFGEVFGKQLPRSTELLVEKGRELGKSEIKTGDLVFFKTGFKRRHVGIYMGQNKFVHVSSKKGVMMSDMNNPYWRDVFWQARRAL